MLNMYCVIFCWKTSEELYVIGLCFSIFCIKKRHGTIDQTQPESGNDHEQMSSIPLRYIVVVTCCYVLGMVFVRWYTDQIK